MSTEIAPIVMPKWGLAMQEGMVAKWLVEAGTTISAGQEILEIETSKIANVFESPVEGVLRRQVAAEGETLPVGALLAVVAPEAVSDDDLAGFVEAFNADFAAKAEEAEPAPEPAIIEVGGKRIRYLELGSGDAVPLVFIHGFGGDLKNWQFNQEDLAQDRATIAVDLPGHGGSTKEVSPKDASVEALAGLMAGFLGAKGIGKAHLVGHSLGGAIALQLALDHGHLVASVTAICSAGLGPEINHEYLNGFVSAKRRKQLQPVLEMLFADPSLVSREMIEEILKFRRLDGVDQALKTILEHVFPGGTQGFEARSRLGAVGVPLQIVWGRDDRVIPVSHAEATGGSVPVHILDRTGHMAHIEKASEVNALIRAFVA